LTTFMPCILSDKTCLTRLVCCFQEVQFEVADATKREYKPETFDVIYSRDTILHIPDKLSLFKQFYVSLYFMLFITIIA